MIENHPHDTNTHMLILRYKGKQGKHTLKTIRLKTTKNLPEDNYMKLLYTGTRLGAKFNVKDKKKKHHHGIIRSVKCQMKIFPESYNDKTVGD